MESSNDSLSIMSPTIGGASAVLLTPGRTRNIAQDMEALRLSRQDNPYLQQVMASRESLIEGHAEECGSDDTVLMSQEFGSVPLDFAGEDPLTLKEVHEHMIRSPPPTSCWPHGSLSQRASGAFAFAGSPEPHGTAPPARRHKEEAAGGGQARSPRRAPRPAGRAPRPSRSASPRDHEPAPCARPLSLPGESHLRNALCRKAGAAQAPSERFSLLAHPRPLRRTHAAARADDSVRLVPPRD